MMEPNELIELLKTLPEVRLKLIEIAWRVTKEDGSLDEEMLAFQHKEIREATAEAEAYESETREAIRCLKAIPL